MTSHNNPYWTKKKLKSKFCEIPGVFELALDRFSELITKGVIFWKNGHVINPLVLWSGYHWKYLFLLRTWVQMIPILVTDDDVRSETKIEARHGRLRPAQESIGLNLRSQVNGLRNFARHWISKIMTLSNEFFLSLFGRTKQKQNT